MNHDQYLPEGFRHRITAPLPFAEIERLRRSGEILEARVHRCDERHNLHLTFAGYEGIIPREEAVSPRVSGAEKEISVLSRVGHPVAFRIADISVNGAGKPTLLLTRSAVQEEALDHLLENCPAGTVLRCRVTHLEPFGAFVDIGCGVTALLPLEYISVARINHPKERISVGQHLICVVKNVDVMQNRFTVSHKELLGTWLENAALFRPGETVVGAVRGIKDYGIFVELTPNLSGLAEYQPGLEENDRVSVFIRNIRPEQMKIKLQILKKLPLPQEDPPLSYYITDGPLLRWQYAPPGCAKPCPAVTFS